MARRKAREAGDDRQLDRRRQVWELRTSLGWTQTKIAREVGVDQATISRDLTWCYDLFRKEHSEDVAKIRARQSLLLDRIVQEAMEAWYASRGIKHTVLESGIEIETIAESSSHGSTKYLAVALKALDDQRKIWGVDAPVGLDLTSGGKPILFREVVAELPSVVETPEERLRKARGEA